MERHIIILLLLSLFNFSWGQADGNYLSLSDNGNGSWNVNYTSEAAIGGFQFNVDGVSGVSGSGGDAGSAGMFIQASGNLMRDITLAM